MKFSTHIKHKTKLLLLSLLLTLSMIIPILQYSTLQVQAEYDPNVGGGGSNGSVDNVTGGQPASYTRTGWLLYVSDKSGKLCSPVAFIASFNKLPTAAHRSDYLKSRIGNQPPSRILLNAPWGPPITSSGSAYAQVRNYVQAKGDSIVRDYLGQNILDTVKANRDNYFLVMEVVSWHAVGGSNRNAVANHWGWVNMWADGIAQPSGKAFYCYNRCAISEYLDKEWPGLPPKVTYLPSDNTSCIPLATLQSAGYGMAAFKLGEGGQTTADEPLIPTPHTPPNESEGIKTIIKSYRSVNDSTNVVTDDGCTHRDNVNENITVEEEGEYAVVGWKTSNQKDYGLDSITWPVPGRITQQGGTSGSVTLNSPLETVLYVLLEKHESTQWRL